MDKHHKGIAFAGHVLLPLQEGGNKLWGIWDQEVKISEITTTTKKYAVQFLTTDGSMYFTRVRLIHKVRGTQNVLNTHMETVQYTSTNKWRKKYKRHSVLQVLAAMECCWVYSKTSPSEAGMKEWVQPRQWRQDT